MSKILVFGHQNPDTDAIGAAISFAYLQKELGKETEAVALGTPSEETQYALDYFNIEAPRVVTEAASETNQVMLVDHNEFQQSISDIAEVNILAVVDHHRIANFETADPLYYRAEPVGCTSTIIYKMFKENNVTIPAQIAGMMVSAIISDTLLFKSPTCTQEDIDAAHALADIAEINLEGYGLDLLKHFAEVDGLVTDNIFDDCGARVYTSKQNCGQGGSGAGCSAIVYSAYLHKELLAGKLHKILLVPTGALLSRLSTMQGESIPSIAHAIDIEI